MLLVLKMRHGLHLLFIVNERMEQMEKREKREQQVLKVFKVLEEMMQQVLSISLQ